MHRPTKTSASSSSPKSSCSSSSFITLLGVWTTVSVMTVALLAQPTEGVNKKDYEKLLSTLFNNYTADARPINEQHNTTLVFMALYLFSILGVKEKNQTLKTSAILAIVWSDEYLSWDPVDHKNITSILRRQKDLWLPDLVVGNTVSSHKELGYDNLKVRVNHKGLIVWIPSGVFETACNIDVTYYPFDTQVCHLEFHTAVSVKSEVRVIINEKNPIDLSEFSENGLWKLTSHGAENVAQNDSKSITEIKFKFQLQRRSSYYVLNIILPVLLLSLTSSLTFALPSDAGEKMGLSITVLLAFAVYLTLVNDAMPITSVEVSVVTVYLVLLLAFTTTSVILSVFILRLHHRPPSCPITGCLATAIPTLRGWLFMPPIPLKELQEERINGDGDSKGSGNTQEKEDAAKQDLPLQMSETSPTPRPRLNAVNPAKAWDLSSETSVTSKSKVKAVSGRRVAETLDKLIFVLFTSFSLISTVVCFVVLFVGASKQFSSTRLS